MLTTRFIFYSLAILTTLLATLSSMGINVAPIWDMESTDQIVRSRSLGPVFESIGADGKPQFLALRPLWSRIALQDGAGINYDLLWPLGNSTVENNELNCRFIPAYYYDSNTTDAVGRRYFYLLPVVFSGRTANDESYLAVFPVAGNLKEFMGFDNIWFWLFPLYLSTEKRDTRGRHLFWPIFANIEGTDVKKFRIFPFWGYSRRTDELDQWFLLWPFFHYARSLRPESEGRSFFLFPIYGRIDYDLADGRRHLRKRAFMWPFFTWERRKSSVNYRVPWPFVQLDHSLDRLKWTRFYLWPIFGKKSHRDGDQYRFALWPFFHSYYERQDDKTTTRRYGFPFYWSVIDYQDELPVSSYRRFWPFFSIERRPGDYRRFRCFDIWPQRTADSIDRNWSPFWTIYAAQFDGDSCQHDFLWGLIKYRRKGNSRRVSIAPFINLKFGDQLQ